MKWIILYYRILTSISLILGISVLLDTFVLNQMLKKFMVKANTSSISPYNSDGVLNILAIVVFLIVAPSIIYFLRNVLFNGD